MKSLFPRKKKDDEKYEFAVQSEDVDRLMQEEKDLGSTGADLTTGLWGGDDVMPKIHLLVDNIINSKKREGKEGKISYLKIIEEIKENGESVGLDFNDDTIFDTQYRPHIKTSPAFIKWKLNEERKDKERSDEESNDGEERKGGLMPSSLEMVNMDKGGRKTRRKRRRKRKRTKRKRTRRKRTKKTRRKRRRKRTKTKRRRSK